MLKLLDREFRITVINLVKTLVEKVENIQKWVDNISREMKALRKKIQIKARHQQYYNRNEKIPSMDSSVD